MNNNLKTARSFAKLLHQKDFESAKGFIASFCEFKVGSETLHGPSAIVSVYESQSVKVKGVFDKIDSESAITEKTPEQIEIIYTDVLTKSGKTHRFQRKQVLDFDPKGDIITITLVRMEGEQERLNAFQREVGLPVTN
jgi:hypothetical protein